MPDLPETPETDFRRNFYISQLLLQVFFVGVMLGLFRTAVPALSESRFGVPEGAFFLLSNFIVVFGLVKSVFNFLSSRLSDSFGRKRILVSGWLIALPVPWIVAYAPDSWGWWSVIAATFLLAINQGICWSMSQIMKIDLIERRRHGLAMGLNETFGYCGVAVSGYFSAWLTVQLGLNQAMLWLGSVIAAAALIDALLFCRETLPGAATMTADAATGRAGQGADSARALFVEASFRNVSTMALCLAGLVEKFVDVLVWLIYPVFLYSRGVDLVSIGLITGVYAATWGILQLFTGSLSDRWGRGPFIVFGMLACAAGSLLTLFSMEQLWWILNAVLIGAGMAMLYPTLGAAVSDRSSERHRGTVMGIYRFWRDSGYFFGALLFAAVATLRDDLASAFMTTAICMTGSALFVAFAADRRKEML